MEEDINISFKDLFVDYDGDTKLEEYSTDEPVGKEKI